MLRKLVIPPHVDTLEHVHEEEESNEDGREVPVHEFDEDDAPLNHIERLGHVHQAAEDIITIPDEITDGLDNHPGAHICGALGLVGKLEVVEAERDTKQENDDPVNYLQYETAYGDASVVLARTNIRKFVLDNGNKSSQQEEEADVTVDQIASNDYSKHIEEDVRSILKAV